MQKIKPLESIAELGLGLQKAIQAIPKNDHYVIALSGGMDSVALLYFCLPYLKQHAKQIEAVHVNHGLSANASDWASFCVEICSSLGVVCYVDAVEVCTAGKGLEAAARQARYSVFERYLSNGGVLLQGHHLNDQAETVLMRLIKGLGPSAIKGIPTSRRLSSGEIYRPWMSLSRVELLDAVAAFALPWVEDESNQDSRFERNFIRNDILPLLQHRHPRILDNLSQAANKAKASQDFIEQWCQDNKSIFLSKTYAASKALDLSALKAYSSVQQAFILRYWLDLLLVPHPSDKSFERLFTEVLTAKADASPELVWHDYMIRRFDDALFCINRVAAASTSYSVKISMDDVSSAKQKEMQVSLGPGVLTIQLFDSLEHHQASTCLANSNGTDISSYSVCCRINKALRSVEISARVGGEKIKLQPNQTASIKKLYQQEKILPWHRNTLPLMYNGDELVCSLAGFVAYPYQISQNERAEASWLCRLSFAFHPNIP